mgnify:CR=1 FL=1
MKKIIRTDAAPAPIGPYNQAVEAGNMLFVSGQIAMDPATGQMVTINIIREANQAVSYTHLRAHETVLDLVCRLLLEKKNIIKSSVFNLII